MDFSEALSRIKAGDKCYRDGWNGSGMSVQAQFPDAHSKMTGPYLYLSHKGGRVPWLPSQSDLMADDWKVD